MSRDFVTVVSGLPRSGTSMLMRMVSAGGLPLVVDGLREADDDNPHGYFEYEPVKALETRDEWVRAAVGKAVKVISMLLRDLPGACSYRVLFSQREMAEVLASQAKMLDRRGRPRGGDDERMALLFEKHLAQVDVLLASRADMQVLYLPYAETVAAPLRVAKSIDEFLGGGLDVAAMAAAVDPSLYRRKG